MYNLTLVFIISINVTCLVFITYTLINTAVRYRKVTKRLNRNLIEGENLIQSNRK